MQCIFININSFDEINRIYLHKKEIEVSENIFVAEYMLNKISIHVFVNSSSTFLRCALNELFLCFPVITVDTSVTQQKLE